jgi:hypothetical protein
MTALALGIHWYLKFPVWYDLQKHVFGWLICKTDAKIKRIWILVLTRSIFWNVCASNGASGL